MLFRRLLARASFPLPAAAAAVATMWGVPGCGGSKPGPDGPAAPTPSATAAASSTGPSATAEANPSAIASVNPGDVPPVDSSGGRMAFVQCNPEKRPEMCTHLYKPVCAEVDNGVRCVTTPCNSTDKKNYGNACAACADPKVAGHWPVPCEQLGNDVKP